MLLLSAEGDGILAPSPVLHLWLVACVLLPGRSFSAPSPASYFVSHPPAEVSLLPSVRYSCNLRPPVVFRSFSLFSDFFQSVFKDTAVAFPVLVLFKSWMRWHINLENRFKPESKFKYYLHWVQRDIFHSFHHLELFSVNYLVFWLCHDWLVANPAKWNVFHFLWMKRPNGHSFF